MYLFSIEKCILVIIKTASQYNNTDKAFLFY